MKRLIAILLLFATLGAFAGTSLMMKHKSGGCHGTQGLRGTPTNSTSVGNGEMLCYPITTSCTGTPSEFIAQVGYTNSTNQIQFALYSDSAGAPNSLLCTGAATSGSNIFTGQTELTSAVSGCGSLVVGTYWMCEIPQSSADANCPSAPCAKLGDDGHGTGVPPFPNIRRQTGLTFGSFPATASTSVYLTDRHLYFALWY